MIRRLPIACLALVAAATATGCTTFSNNDAVAKVGDETLTRDEFAELVSDSPTPTSAGATPTTVADDSTVQGDEGRGLIQLWVLGRLLDDEVTRIGGTITDADRQAAADSLAGSPDYSAGSDGFKQMFADAQAAYVVWGRQLAATSGLKEKYDQGPEASGFTCAAHILVASEKEAQDVLAELEQGTPFAEVAQTTSTDTQSGQAGGSLGCQSTEEFKAAFVPEFVEGALAAEVGVPTQPVRSDFGFHIIQLQPYDEVVDQLAQADARERLPQLTEEAEVWVDPRYGTFEAGEVTPLNSGPAADAGV